uniref:RING-type domain-containing protein n=1 Tax=Meloidogyne enterolobii TaxID=390850 RepID=A0A6V7VHF4_MELEN|nr:unnamed protein product [Meloidogyne enterolobii]
MINVGQIFFDKSSVKAVTDIIKIDEESEDEICNICHVNLIEEDQKILQKTDCNHIFHKECLQKWLKKKSGKGWWGFFGGTCLVEGGCPTCRATVLYNP